MKKFISVALATAMIASLGVTAFADNDYEGDVKNIEFHEDFFGVTNDDKDELYFVLAHDGALIYDDASAAESANNAAVTALGEKADAYEAAATAVDGFVAGSGAGTIADEEALATYLNSKIEGLSITDETVAADVLALVDISTFQAGVTTEAQADALLAAVDTSTLTATATALDEQAAALATATYIDYDEIEDIDDLKVTIKLTGGDEYVADYYIDEAGDDYDGMYAVVIELNDNYTTKKQKIKGEITIKNKTKKLEEHDFTYSHRVNKLVVEGGEDASSDNYGGVTELEYDGEDVYINLVELNDIMNPVVDFSKDVENIELEDDNGFYFDVKASDQGKLNLTYDNVAIKSVARVAPVDADLSFFNFYGYPQFDFTGKVTLTPEEDDVEYFVYAVSKDGKISKVNAKLNEDGDAYEFKTRTLGCYVLSDMELPVDEINEEEAPAVDAPVADDAVVAPEVEDVKANPGTGC